MFVTQLFIVGYKNTVKSSIISGKRKIDSPIIDDTFSVFFTVKSAKSLEPDTLRYSIGYQVMAK